MTARRLCTRDGTLNFSILSTNPTEKGEENSMQVEDSVGDDCDDVEILDATEVSD